MTEEVVVVLKRIGLITVIMAGGAMTMLSIYEIVTKAGMFNAYLFGILGPVIMALGIWAVKVFIPPSN